MAERKTLLSSSTEAPKAQPGHVSVAPGAFGNYSGLVDFGQGLARAGQVGAGYAAQQADMQRRALQEKQQKLDHQQRRDIRNQAKAEFMAVSMGVKESVLRDIQGRAISGDPKEYLTAKMAEARSAFSERVSGLRADPRFSEVYGDDEENIDWMQLEEGLIDNVLTYDAATRLESRVNNYQTRVTALGESLGDSPDKIISDTTALIGELSGDNLPRSATNALTNAAADKLYAKLDSAITLDGALLDEAKIRSLRVLTEQQRQALVATQRKLNTPKALTNESANTILSSYTESLRAGTEPDPRVVAEVPLAIRALEANSQTDGVAAARLRSINAEINAANTFGQIGTAADTATYQELVTIQTALRSPETASQYVANTLKSTAVDGIPNSVTDPYRTQALAKISRSLEAITTGRATEVLDRSDTLRPIVSEMQTTWKRAIAAQDPADISATAAQLRTQYTAYRSRLEQEYAERGIPEELRVYVPHAWASSIEDSFLQEQGNAAVAGIYNIRAALGRSGVEDLIKRFSAPNNNRLSDKAHWAAFTAKQFYDTYGDPDGTINHAAMGTAKELFDSIANLPEKERQWSELMGDWSSVADSVYEKFEFSSEATAETVLEGDRISDITSARQSFRGLEFGVAATFQSPALQAGWKRFVRAAIAHRALTADPAVREGTADRVSAFAQAGRDLLNNLSQTMTVVSASASDNPHSYFTIAPTSLMAKEGFAEFPKVYGASDAVDLGDSASSVLGAITKDISSHTNRSGLGNVVDAAETFRDVFFRHLGPTAYFRSDRLNDSILPLPDAFRINWGNTDIAPNYAGADNPVTSGNLAALGAAGDDYTVKGLSFQQNGLWLFENGYFQAYITSGPQEGAGADDVSTTSRVPVRYKDGTPVRISAQSVWLHDYSFRQARMGYHIKVAAPLIKGLRDAGAAGLSR